MDVSGAQDTIFSDDSISHYGVKGMHWGVRKGKQTSTRSKLSDKELKKRLDRASLEQRYSDMNQSTVTKGKKAVKKSVARFGGVAFGALSAAVIKKGVKRMIK